VAEQPPANKKAAIRQGTEGDFRGTTLVNPGAQRPGFTLGPITGAPARPTGRRRLAASRSACGLRANFRRLHAGNALSHGAPSL